MKESDDRPEVRREAAIPAIVLQTRVYTRIMEMGRAAMPGETVGFLLGMVQHDGAAGPESATEGPSRAAEPWIRIDDAVGMRDERVGDLKQTRENGQAGMRELEVVGWFYADPGIGIFSPAVSLRDVQDSLPATAGLLLLVNPAADQGAFYRWNGTHYLPTDGFYEAVLRENAFPMIAWNGEVRGAGSWFGPLLGELSPDVSRPERMGRQAEDGSQVRSETSAEGERETPAEDGSAAEDETTGGEKPTPGEEPLPAADEPGQETSFPIFVEVITEEPVEYVPPQRPADTLDLIPGPELFPEGLEETETGPPSPDLPIPRPPGTTAPLDVPPPGREGSEADSSEGTNPEPREDASAGSVLPGRAPSGEPEGGAQDPQSTSAPDSGPMADLQPAGGSLPGVHVAYVAPELYTLRGALPAILAPVKHSIVRPTIKKESAREGLMTLGSLLGIIALVAFLLGRPQHPEGTGEGNALVSEPAATEVRIEVILPGQERASPAVPNGTLHTSPSPVPTETLSASTTPVPLEAVDSTGATPTTHTQSPPGEIAP